MSTLANSFDSLSNSFDIGITDFANMTTNKVYTSMHDIEESILGFGMGALGKIQSFTSGIASTVNKILKMPGQIYNTVKNAIDNIINRILGSPLFGFMGDVLGFLTSLSGDGLKGWLANELGLGNMSLCNNLNVLQQMLDGVFIPDEILNGMFLGASIDWANRICKPYTYQQESRATNKERLNMIVPYKGIEPTKDNALFDFSGLVSGYVNTINPFKRRSYSMGQEDLFDAIDNTDINNLDAIIGHGITSREKMILLHKVDTIHAPKARSANTGLIIPSMFNDGRQEVRQLRSHISGKETYTREEVMTNINHGKSKESLGSFIKNLATFDLDTISEYNRTEMETNILDGLYELQKVSRSPVYGSKEHTGGSFSNHDFKELNNIFGEWGLDYMGGLPPSELSYRYNGLHPTAEVFVGNNIPYSRPKEPIKN